MRVTRYEMRVAGCEKLDTRYGISYISNLGSRILHHELRIPNRISRISYLTSRISAKWTGAIHRVNDMRDRDIIDRVVNGRRGGSYGGTAI